MRKSSINTFVVLILIFLLNIAATTVFNFGDLKSKDYFTKIFAKKEIKKLAKLEKSIKKYSVKLEAAKVYLRKSDGYKKLASESNSNRAKKKYAKKANKNAKKGYKKAFKAYDKIFDSKTEKYKLYKAKLIKMQNDGSEEHELARLFSDTSKIIFNDGINKIKKASKKVSNEKFNLYQKADTIITKAIEFQELAFGLFQKDKTIKIEEIKKAINKNENSNKENNNNNSNNSNNNTENNNNDNTNNIVVKDTIPRYNPDEDPNIYVSKQDTILKRLSISNEDKQLLADAKQKTHIADSLMLVANNKYKTVEALQEQASKIKNVLQKDLKTQEAATLEQNIFKEFIKSAKLYSQANETTYNVYKKYFKGVRPINNQARLNTGLKYEEDAEKLYSNAKSTISDALLQMYVSEKYLQLMDANQLELAAIQQQENAYCSYLGLTVSPLQKGMKYIDTYTKTKTVSDTTKTKNNKPEKVKTNVKYSYAGTYQYSIQHPKPYLIKRKDGITFKIQVGIFKNLLPLKKFGTYSPITYDKFTNNEFKRFMVGDYRSYQTAEYVLKKIKEKGYKDAFIVGYVNGKRRSYKYAKSLVTENEDYVAITNKEMSYFTGKNVNIKETSNSNYPKGITYGTGTYDFAKGSDITKTKGLIYAVQFGMYQLPKTNKELNLIRPLFEERTAKGVKFFKGVYASENEALWAKQNLERMGIKNPFVVAYNNGQKISISKSRKIAKTVKPNNITNNDAYFAIQIGAYSSAPSEEVKTIFNKISQKYTISSIEDANGLTIYSVGKYKTLKEASNNKKALIKSGYKDVFLIAYKGNKKISIKEANKLLKNK